MRTECHLPFVSDILLYYGRAVARDRSISAQTIPWNYYLSRSSGLLDLAGVIESESIIESSSPIVIRGKCFATVIFRGFPGQVTKVG